MSLVSETVRKRGEEDAFSLPGALILISFVAYLLKTEKVLVSFDKFLFSKTDRREEKT